MTPLNRSSEAMGQAPRGPVPGLGVFDLHQIADGFVDYGPEARTPDSVMGRRDGERDSPKW